MVLYFLKIVVDLQCVVLVSAVPAERLSFIHIYILFKNVLFYYGLSQEIGFNFLCHLVLLPGESQGRGSLVGCRLGGRTSRTRLKRLSSSSRCTVGLCCLSILSDSWHLQAPKFPPHSSLSLPVPWTNLSLVPNHKSEICVCEAAFCFADRFICAIF